MRLCVCVCVRECVWVLVYDVYFYVYVRILSSVAAYLCDWATDDSHFLFYCVPICANCGNVYAV